jgi:site-specific DNA-methyltransferase (adenine-specific)
MSQRQQDFVRIEKALGSSERVGRRQALVACGDSLKLLARIPDHSISLILTDPPYHSTKKANIHGDTHFEEDKDYLDWIESYCEEWKRVLRPNGSVFCFCASDLCGRVEQVFAAKFNVLSQIVWTKPNEPGFDGWKQKMKKEALRQWYAHSERIVFAEPACEGNLHRSSFAHFLRQIRKQAGISAHQLAELTGAYGRVNHGGAVSNWETGRNIPSREQYSKICEAIIGTGNVSEMPVYEDVVRPFFTDSTKEFTDVWNFPSVRPYPGKHPAEKPSSMLEHAINATTFEGDIVLDCFAGSGSTALAALRLGRRTISMEIEQKWVEAIKNRIADYDQACDLKLELADAIPQTRPRQAPQLGLFAATG